MEKQGSELIYLEWSARLRNQSEVQVCLYTEEPGSETKSTGKVHVRALLMPWVGFATMLNWKLLALFTCQLRAPCSSTAKLTKGMS